MPTDVLGMPCDVCARREKVLRFNLARTRSQNGRTVTRGAGSMYLCEDCWTMFAQPRMRVARRRAKANDWSPG